MAHANWDCFSGDCMWLNGCEAIFRVSRCPQVKASKFKSGRGRQENSRRTSNILMQICPTDSHMRRLDKDLTRRQLRARRLFYAHIFFAVVASCAHHLCGIASIKSKRVTMRGKRCTAVTEAGITPIFVATQPPSSHAILPAARDTYSSHHAIWLSMCLVVCE